MDLLSAMDKFKSWFSSKIDFNALAESLDIMRIQVDAMKWAFNNNTIVDGDPPLCQMCSRIFSQPQKLCQTNIMSYNGEKFRKSVELGCYLCSLLNEAVWTPKSGTKGGIIKSKRLHEIDPFPDSIAYWIDEPFGEERPGCFEINFAGVFLDNPSGDTWEVILLLIPEKGMICPS